MEEIPKEHKETLGGDEYVYNLDCDNGFSGCLYMSKPINLHTQIRVVCWMSIILQ